MSFFALSSMTAQAKIRSPILFQLIAAAGAPFTCVRVIVVHKLSIKGAFSIHHDLLPDRAHGRNGSGCISDYR